MSTTGFVTDRDGTWIEKGPGETLDYVVNWADWFVKAGLPAGTISAQDFTVPAGLTKVGNGTISGQKTGVTLQGGTVGQSYDVVASMTPVGTSGPAVRTFTVRVVNR